MKYTAILLLCLVGVALADNYAFLIAGSKGYFNYRHQADVCHAFHILTDKGQIPAENIIVMMEDDIANSPSNPVQGNIINKPDGPNYYPKTNKDYTGPTDCTAANALAILAGDKAGVTGGNGKVLETTDKDNIFVYFADHGAPGLVAMPEGPYLYAKDLIPVLQKMHDDKKFNKLVFYVEACESGSMFADLPKDIDIFATTAANASQSSYAWYFDETRNTYLGDEYSVRWMEDSDVAKFAIESLEQQYKNVAAAVTKSSSLQFGDITNMGGLPIGNFQSSNNGISVSSTVAPDQSIHRREAVSSRDIKLHVLLRQLNNAKSSAEREKLQLLVNIEQEARLHADHQIETLVSLVAGSRRTSSLMHTAYTLRDHDCLKAGVEGFEAVCGRFTDYSLQHVQKIVNLCENGFTSDRIISAARQIC